MTVEALASASRAVGRAIRIIPRLDVKGPNLIKGVHLEGLRVIGSPNAFARQYFESGADELLYIDTVASLYGRNNLVDIVEQAARDVFIPITVGGGIRTIEDAVRLLRTGADKIAVNTAAVASPTLISELANRLGSQAVVLSIQAMRASNGRWKAYTDNGREPTGLDVIEWAKRGASLGAGEVLLTSIDQEGTEKGFDIELVRRVTAVLDIPVIASGGLGSVEDLVDVVTKADADAVAVASVLHYGRLTLVELKSQGRAAGLALRRGSPG